MKAAFLALVAGVSASLNQRQVQFPFNPQCCQAIVTVTQYASMPTSTRLTSSAVAPSPAPPAPVVPTPIVTTATATGVTTFPATTITITATQTLLVPTSQALTPGTNVFGGIVTVVSTATTIVIPIPGTPVSTTTFIAPSAGTFTIVPPTTTVVSASTLVVFPVPATITPGVYVRPQTVITVTVINQVIVVPFNGVVYQTQVVVVNPAPAPAPAAAPAPAPAPAAPAPVVNAVAAPSPSAAAPASNPAPLANGNRWAITYTPYTTSGDCKSASDVLIDLQLISSKGFTAVRLYATDCGGLASVGAAAQSTGLKLIIGVFIKADGIGGAQGQITDIVAWGSAGGFSLVTMIVVGNEAIFNGFANGASLAGFIASARSSFAAAGYTGIVTTSEPLNILQANAGALCAVIDVVGANIQPFFNSAVVASQAGSFVASQLALVAAVCPGKTAYNLESGWPSQGNANGAAVPGVANQLAALASIQASVGGSTVFFSFNNDMWKAAGDFGVEQYFGSIKVF